MNPKANTILYFLSDWFKNEHHKSVTIYRDAKADHVTLVVKNKWHKVVKRKRFRLFGELEPISQMWWNYNSPFDFTESQATKGEVAAYFNRRKRTGKKGSRKRRFIRSKTKEQYRKNGAKVRKLLFGGKK